MDLTQLQNNKRGTITKIRGRDAFHNRIVEMGFAEGTEVLTTKNSAGENRILLKVFGKEVSLSRNEARLIEIAIPKESGGIKTRKESISNKDLDEGVRKRSKLINVALIGNGTHGNQSQFTNSLRSLDSNTISKKLTAGEDNLQIEQDGYEFNILDLQRTDSGISTSSYELKIRRKIFTEIPDIVINIVDSSDLESSLYLTTQLIDMDIRVVIALERYDELIKRGDTFDYKALARMIGIPIIPIVSSKKYGLKDLFQTAINVYEGSEPFVRHVHIDYGKTVESSIVKIQNEIKTDPEQSNIFSSRYFAIKLLEKDKNTIEAASGWPGSEGIISLSQQEITRLEQAYKEESKTLITGARYGFISGALKETLTGGESRKIRTEAIDSFLTHRLFGYPIFLFFMLIMFFSTFELGQYPMDWLDTGVNIFSSWLQKTMNEGPLKDLITEGIIGGVGSVIVFLPNILILFFFISLMEDTGYMARAAFIMDKVMHRIGLHGRSFIPLLMGFGCNVPAIIATRTIENKNNRILTILINPFMSCSARLPVYILLIGAFFPNYPGLMLFMMYFIGIALATGIAILFKKIFFRSEEIPFVMELPPYHVPSIQTTMKHMWQKGVEYLKKMGGIILIGSIIVWALGYYPRTVEYSTQYKEELTRVNRMVNTQMYPVFSGNNEAKERLENKREEEIERLLLKKESERHEKSYIGQIGKFIEPALKPIGFDWKMGVSLLSGIAAKEIVISTMGVLYQVPTNDHSGNQSLARTLREHSTDDGNETRFTPVVALAFMIFILTYFPCVAVIAAIRKETGSWKWALFTIGYTTVLAWVLAFIVYQVGSLFF